jgi:hypothetical protein
MKHMNEVQQLIECCDNRLSRQYEVHREKVIQESDATVNRLCIDNKGSTTCISKEISKFTNALPSGEHQGNQRNQMESLLDLDLNRFIRM